LARSGPDAPGVSDPVSAPGRQPPEGGPAAERSGATIQLDHVTKVYGERGGGRQAVRDLVLEIPAGQICVLVGPSGCGKTTTLKMINRLIEPSGGRLEVLGQDIEAVPVHELRSVLPHPAMQNAAKRSARFVIRDGRSVAFPIKRHSAIVIYDAQCCCIRMIRCADASVVDVEQFSPTACVVEPPVRQREEVRAQDVVAGRCSSIPYRHSESLPGIGSRRRVQMCEGPGQFIRPAATSKLKADAGPSDSETAVNQALFLCGFCKVSLQQFDKGLHDCGLSIVGSVPNKGSGQPRSPTSWTGSSRNRLCRSWYAAKLGGTNGSLGL